MMKVQSLQKEWIKPKLMLIAILASVLFLATLCDGFCGESTTVIVPINMAFPLLPTMTIMSTQSASGGSLIIVSFGADGIAGAIRVSAQQ